MDGIPAVLRAQLNLPEGIGVVVSFVAKAARREGRFESQRCAHAMDDQLIVNAEQLQALIKGKKPGDAVSLTYYRQGKEHTAKAKLAKGARPHKACAARNRCGWRTANGNRSTCPTASAS